MSNPSVSVIVPCYNVAGTVEETIASVSAQTMQDFEILAVDNNCSDNTLDVLAQIAEREPRIRIIKQPVQGLSAARNAGILAAQGRFIAFLDADDLWDADYLESHIANFADESIGISYSRVRLIDESGAPTGQVTKPQLSGLTAPDLLRGNPCTALIVVRKTVFDSAGLFDQELRSVEDQEWLFRAAFHGVRLRGIGRTLASYRIMPGGLSADLSTMQKCHEQLLVAAARIAPGLVREHQRLARASMQRYCARRAIEQGARWSVAQKYLWQMLWVAPELFWHEPVATGKVIARVFLSGLSQLALPMAKRSKEIGNAAG